MPKGFALILSAPSGTGKTTTCRVLREKLPDLKISVSHTTREIRKGEKEGLDYTFISKQEFEEKIKSKDFLEWAQVHNFYYGTSFQAADTSLENGHDTLLELDVQGVESLRAMDYEGIYILILPPSVEEMQARLIKRGTESEDRIRQRVETGKKDKLQAIAPVISEENVDEESEEEGTEENGSDTQSEPTAENSNEETQESEESSEE